MDVERAESVLDLVFHQYDPECLSFIKSKFREKAKNKSLEKRMVDSSFVLRVCLEFYRMECWKRYQLFKDVFHSQPSFKVYNIISIHADACDGVNIFT